MYNHFLGNKMLDQKEVIGHSINLMAPRFVWKTRG